MTDRADDDDAVLAAGDVLAAQLLVDLEPLVFVEVECEAQREAAYRLRYRALAEMGIDAAAAFADGRERDEFDAIAVQIVGREGETVVATCRVVLPMPGRWLPMQTAFGVALDETDDVVEVGRLVVDPAYRGDGHSVLMGLAARAWLSLRSRGYSRAVAATPKRLVALFDGLGFSVTVLGEPRIYWGEERHPILFDGRAAIPRLKRHVDPAG